MTQPVYWADRCTNRDTFFFFNNCTRKIATLETFDPCNWWKSDFENFVTCDTMQQIDNIVYLARSAWFSEFTCPISVKCYLIKSMLLDSLQIARNVKRYSIGRVNSSIRRTVAKSHRDRDMKISRTPKKHRSNDQWKLPSTSALDGNPGEHICVSVSFWYVANFARDPPCPLLHKRVT